MCDVCLDVSVHVACMTEEDRCNLIYDMEEGLWACPSCEDGMPSDYGYGEEFGECMCPNCMARNELQS